MTYILNSKNSNNCKNDTSMTTLLSATSSINQKRRIQNESAALN